MNMPQVGDTAPSFTLPSSEGSPISLKDYRDRIVVLYFYPNDSTPGCSEEAKAFKEIYLSLLDKSAEVLGVSSNDLVQHREFIKKLDLPFPLLSDVDHSVSELYGVWAEKWMYGKKYWGVERVTFVIDKNGVIAQILARVKPEDHAKLAKLEVEKLV